MPKPDDEGVEITRENLETIPAIQQLGVLAVRALKDVGVITLLVRPDGRIAFANPMYVYIERQAVPDPALLDRPYRYVRPVVSDGKTRFVAWKAGRLWEIEYDDEEEPSTSSSQAEGG
jgi:hypothetical protein